MIYSVLQAGVAILSTMAAGICCPVNAESPPGEIVSDLLASSVAVVITLAGDEESGESHALLDALNDAQLVVLELTPSTVSAGLFSLKTSNKTRPPRKRVTDTISMLTNRNDCALLLQTSGTSGKKKIVPYSLETVAIGAACVAASWQLSYGDVCLNMMPLFHAGGIIRNLLAPILAGGSTILCPGFDGIKFWDVVSSTATFGVTWYYASPTMHAMILAESTRLQCIPRHTLRLVANAAGPLQPSLARKLQDTFGQQTVVLPSYGMTECMPISSPPLNYKASERLGTSGRSVGPEISIRDSNGVELPVGMMGNISIRGPPLFQGYEDPNATLDSHLVDGWFNTGDVGYMDGDGYLYITGRSKEVINRGGELISPVEVEDALLRAVPGVSAVMAISVPHEVLQEVVGVVIAVAPGTQRPSLKTVQEAVATSLHPSKWPQVLIYMDQGLPLSNSHKVLRIDMARRLGLPDLGSSISELDRLFEAQTPSPGAPVQSSIPCRAVDIDRELREAADLIMLSQPSIAEAALCTYSGRVVCLVVRRSPSNAKTPAGQPPVQAAIHQAILLSLDGKVSNYVKPVQTLIVKGHIHRGLDGRIDMNWLQNQCLEAMRDSVIPKDDIEECVQRVFAHVLGLSVQDVGLEDDFFTLGGDSTRAGKVLAGLRRHFPLPLQVSSLYQYRTVEAMSSLLKAKLLQEGVKFIGGNWDDLKPSSTSEPLMLPYDPTSPAVLLTQLIPLTVIFPILKVSTWILFLVCVSSLYNGVLLRVVGDKQLSNECALFILLFAYMLTRTARQIIFPLFAIVFKLVVIGRYHEGVYPTFSAYYLRWWLVDQVIRLCGHGVFGWGYSMLPLYYRLMGARVGNGVTIHPRAEIREFDLVSIGDRCCLDDSAVVSPFGLLSGCFELRPITLGAHTTMGPASIAVPGSVIKKDGYFPPCSTTYDIHPNLVKHPDKDSTLSRYSSINNNSVRSAGPRPDLWCIMAFGTPVVAAINLISFCPVIATTYWMLRHADTESSSYQSFYDAAESLLRLVFWFAAPCRWFWYVIIALANDILVPMVRLTISILFKRLVLGPFKEGRRTHSQVELLRYWFVEKLLDKDKVQQVALILGPNLPTSGWILRALGAKVGKRIFWPGSGLDITEFDLLKIEDDVVFGSRSRFYASDTAMAKGIIIRRGSMVSDRCILQPGCEIGRNAILGSGTVAPHDFRAPGGSVWLGNDEGCRPIIWQESSKDAETAKTISPYGRAFFNRRSTYFVWPLGQVLLQNVTISALSSALWVLPLLLILRATRSILLLEDQDDYLLSTKPALLLCITLGLTSMSFVVTSIIAFTIDIVGKWFIIGRRKEGRFNWDSSSYNQRWQLHKQLQKMRMCGRDYLLTNLIQGSQYLVWYFRVLGADIGRQVCLYPNGADPMMTEPDLVTIGDMSSIDNASLVAHINSKGIFHLNRLTVGKGCVLRRNTRLLSGAAMEDFSTMLEHTLVVSGDSLGAGTTWQGWPAGMVKVEDVKRRNNNTFVHIRTPTSTPQLKTNSPPELSSITIAD